MTSADKKSGLMLLFLGIAVVVVLLVHIVVGSGTMTFSEVLSNVLSGPSGDSGQSSIIWQLRLPRAFGCILVGGILGAVGSVFQALFRNPLAEPYIVGVSSGAAVGGALAFVLKLSAWAGGLGTVAMGFVTGMMSLGLVFGLARRRGVIEVESLLLSGVAVSSLLASIVSLLIYVAGENPMEVLRWLLGSMTPMPWIRVAFLAIALVVGGAVLFAQGRRLNAFAVGEESAARLGVDVKRLKPTILVTGTAMVAVAVGCVGVIGFLGLAAPHLARRIIAVDWRWSLMGSVLLGSIMLLVSDLLAQRAIAGAEIPVGIVTAVLGAPFLLALLRKS